MKYSNSNRDLLDSLVKKYCEGDALDVGGGYGRYTAMLKKHFNDVKVLDMNPKADIQGDVTNMVRRLPLSVPLLRIRAGLRRLSIPLVTAAAAAATERNKLPQPSKKVCRRLVCPAAACRLSQEAAWRAPERDRKS